MTLDYDLVVIGNTPEASYAAVEAAKLKARVAWVLTEQNPSEYTEINRYTLSHFIHLEQQWQATTQWDISSSLVQSNCQPITLNKWINQSKNNINSLTSAAMVAAMGVDVIFESGEFCRLPQQAFVLPSRKLRSRTYLVATGSLPWIPPILGLSEVGYLTPDTLSLENLPQTLIIVGETPLAVELAQTLNRLGKTITLVTENRRILPQEEVSISQLIQAQLEAEGIELLTETSLTQVKQINGKKWVQVGNQAIETDEIILMGNQPNIQNLNLEGVKVALTSQTIPVNTKLQTTNPKIYVCGSAIGGYKPTNVARYEAKIAVKNALFFPWFKVKYNHLVYSSFTYPCMTRIGLTEPEAKQQYGDKKIIVVKASFKTLSKAQITGEITGFCQMITRSNGQILGCHCVGLNSDELMSAIALAIQNKIPIQKLSRLFPPHPTIAEILFDLANQWQAHQFQSNKFLSQALENLLFWRRKWS